MARGGTELKHLFVIDPVSSSEALARLQEEAKLSIFEVFEEERCFKS